MKILLTGGAGFIGSHTCVELCEAGHEPVIVDNYVNSCEEAVHRVEQIVGHSVPIIKRTSGMLRQCIISSVKTILTALSISPV